MDGYNPNDEFKWEIYDQNKFLVMRTLHMMLVQNAEKQISYE